ncbi:hypothetical protein D6D22_10323 [Aureobasidium pullulans]|uniref:Uncharacterized protein n=1 Tax=Aureobasidium pullulans TaxID=5580 RepID=A0A4S8WX02_AURPU|nr:hypothetical protein D6D22_10323 [Aureobasidium pullulans]
MSFLIEVNGGAGRKWQAPARKAALGQPWTCGSTGGRGVARGNPSMPEWSCAIPSTVQCCRLVEGRESVADIERARVAEIKDFHTSHLLCLLVPASFGAGGSSPPTLSSHSHSPFILHQQLTNLSFRPSFCSRDFSAQLDSQATVEYR